MSTFSEQLRFRFEEREYAFRAPSADDHILQVMQQTGSFYELDVLACLRERLHADPRGGGCAIDAGGYIGTHSVFLALACGLRPVLAFEPNPRTFGVLQANVLANGLGQTVECVNVGLGATPGRADLEPGPQRNGGLSRLRPRGSGAIPVTTVDEELRLRALGRVSVVKIDVEGQELDVLRGALGTVARDLPLLCIEVHTLRNLWRVLALLAPWRYGIVDCLGGSPTYVLEPRGRPRRPIATALWMARAALPSGWRGAREALRRLAVKSVRAATAPPRD